MTSSPVALIQIPSNPDEAVLYYLNDPNKLQLAYERRPLGSTEWVGHVDNGATKSNIISPSTMAAVNKHGIPTVYGLTQYPKVAGLQGEDPKNPKDGGNEAAVISQVSPISNPIGNRVDFQTGYIGIAAVTDNASAFASDFIYYLRVPPAGTKPKIHQAVIKEGATPGPPHIFQSTRPSENTKLAAVYDPADGSRSVFYQSDPIPDDPEDNIRLSVLKIDAEEQHPKIEPIPGTDDIEDKTPIAVTTAGTGADRTTYLYYFTIQQGKRALTRIDRKGNGNWGEPKVVNQGKVKARKDSLLVALQHAGHNHVFMIAPDGTAYTNHKDPLKPAPEPST